MPRSSLLDLLTGGDRRSIGRSQLVVRRVLRSPALLPLLVRGLSVRDALIRMRAADALEKIGRSRPELLRRYRLRLLRIAQRSSQPEVQWHMAQLFPRLDLSRSQLTLARRTLRRYLGSTSAIVQTMALDALVQLAPPTPAGRVQSLRLLQRAGASTFPAVRARARRLRSTLRNRTSRQPA